VGILKTISTLTEKLSAPTPWPNANARLLGLGLGLPVKPLDRLAQFSPLEFERFTLEWASRYLPKKYSNVYEVQQRGGAGDKGRDIVVWFDAPSAPSRRWSLYQCKHYDNRLGVGDAAAEIGKVLYYTLSGAYSAPEEYWFITHLGVTSDFQDMLDNPKKLQDYTLSNWNDRCAKKITSKETIQLTAGLRAHIETFDFSVFRAKQPIEIVNEHARTRYHLAVFGAPLIDRPPPPSPPSSVAAGETEYVSQLYAAIGEDLGKVITDLSDFADHAAHTTLFDRSRITFYCAEGLKELARDQMADATYFDTLLDEFSDGLYHNYTALGLTGLRRLASTVTAAQTLQLGGHVLAPHVRAKDREGMCHQMANEQRLIWCKP
jgi:ABC-3C protein